MKRQKKGFTVVELVIVIAVIAILAAVLIPTFSSLIKKANVSNDTMLVKSLNTAMTSAEILNKGEKPRTMHEALTVAKENGYSVEKLTPTSADCDILWNSKTNRFELYNRETNTFANVGENLSTTATDLDKWIIVDSIPTAENQKYSMYLTGTSYDQAVETAVGFDAGNNTLIPTITYATDKVQEVTIRTNGGELVVNAANSDVNHYDYASFVRINDVATTSYHEHGEVGELVNEKGHLVVEAGSIIYVLDVKSTITATIKGGATVVAMSEASQSKVELLSGAAEIPTFNAEDKPTAANHAHKFGADYTQNDVIYHNCKVCGFKEKADSQLYKEFGENKTYFARVGDVIYETIDEAIAAANYTEESNVKVLRLLKDVSYDNQEHRPTIQNGQKIILDLNGQIWQPTSDWYVIQIAQGGALTIMGDGKIKSFDEETSSSLIDNYGTLTIQGGTFESTGATVIKNEPDSTCVINGGTFTQLNGTRYTTSSEVYYMLTMMNYGATTINGGIFTSASPYCINNDVASSDKMGELHINGGEFTATGNKSYSVNIRQYNMNISISGGMFNNAISLGHVDSTRLTGGIFIIDSVSNLLNKDISSWVDRYAVYNMEEGRMMITKSKPTENYSATATRNGNENIFFIGEGGANKALEFSVTDGTQYLKLYETPTYVKKIATYSSVQVEYIGCNAKLDYELLDKDTEIKITNNGNAYTYVAEPIIEKALYYIERDGQIIRYFTDRDKSNVFNHIKEGDILKLNKDITSSQTILNNVSKDVTYNFTFDLNGYNITVKTNYGLLVTNSSNSGYNNCNMNVTITNSKEKGGVVTSKYYMARIYAGKTEGYEINITFDNIKFVTTGSPQTQFMDDSSKGVANYLFTNCTFNFYGQEYVAVDSEEGNPTFQRITGEFTVEEYNNISTYVSNSEKYEIYSKADEGVTTYNVVLFGAVVDTTVWTKVTSA